MKIQFLALLVAGLCVGAVTANADTLVLQQGTNGYTGCADTHVYVYAHDVNYGNSAALLLLTEHYDPN